MKNLVQIEGNLGQDPVHTQLSSGKHVTRLSIAVNKSWTKGKEKKQTTDWFRVECWDKLALLVTRDGTPGSRKAQRNRNDRNHKYEENQTRRAHYQR